MNTELIRKVRDQILMEPESHDQRGWLRLSEGCGTTACVAGWAVMLGTKIDYSRIPRDLNIAQIAIKGVVPWQNISAVAAEVLNMGALVAGYLFSADLSREEVLEALDIAIKTDDEVEVLRYLVPRVDEEEVIYIGS